MNPIQWISLHPFWTFLMYVLFMLATQALPKPDATSGKLYLWVYAFCHLLSANVGLVSKVLNVKLPAMQVEETTLTATHKDGSTDAISQTTVATQTPAEPVK